MVPFLIFISHLQSAKTSTAIVWLALHTTRETKIYLTLPNLFRALPLEYSRFKKKRK